MIIAFALALALHAVAAHHMPWRNPTEFVFTASEQQVRDAFTRAFEKRTFRGLTLDWQTPPLFAPPEAQRAARAGDAYLHAFHEPIVRSPVYHRKGEPLPYLAEFLVRFTRDGSQLTKVVIKTFRCEVIDGKTLGVHGPANRYVRVDPTTIEEYEILLRLGAELGEKGMPALRGPRRGQ